MKLAIMTALIVAINIHPGLTVTPLASCDSYRMALQPTMAPPPHILRFEATPTVLFEDEPLLLEWESEGAVTAELSTSSLPGNGPVPVSGSIAFKRVPAGTYRFELVVWSTSTPPRSDRALLTIVTVIRPEFTVVDDTSQSGFSREGPVDFWRESESGYLGHAFWTFVSSPSAVNSAQWQPDLKQRGIYRVAAYVPAQNGTTQAARYEIHSRTGIRVVVLPQAGLTDEWGALGIFEFDSGKAGLIRLTDFTGEREDLLRRIAIDAIRWELVSACNSTLFLPGVTRPQF